MTGYHYSASHNAWTFIAEPILNHDRSIVAMEVLTRFATPGTPPSILSRMPREQKKILLTEQLIQIMNKRVFFEKNNILCSVNIDFDMAYLLIEDEEVNEMISACSYIRLEVSEAFPNLSDGYRNPLLKALHSRYPLWLDDFGSGSSNLRSLQEGLYERVKIDKTFFWKNHSRPELKSLFKRIRKYTCVIIIEGIEKEEYLEIFTDEDILYQGYLFKHASLSSIG
ncbi:EAL domain-containing protein [Erwiniaceae bacterium L1_54_6]|jgi:EAL domain-containing protein (putative c-di-GMP-specific phosphodiesterase class I)|nr:EAL domain-containing protein [Erwiniaceae bacterium L1_54_6]